MHKTLLFLVAISLPACAYHQQQKQLDQTLTSHNCEGALKKNPFESLKETSVRSTEYLGKNALAYTYIAGNYTTEVLWDVSAGVVLFVGLCGPMIAIAATGNATFYNPPLADSTGQLQRGSFPCLPSPKSAKSLFSPPLGRKSIAQTRSFRCPDNEPLLKTLEKVLTCHEKQENLDKALQTLDNLESSEGFYNCLTDLQKLSLQSKRLDLQKLKANSQKL
jgi:hypothetical protein